jgi:hypothetical protein
MWIDLKGDRMVPFFVRVAGQTQRSSVSSVAPWFAGEICLMQMLAIE